MAVEKGSKVWTVRGIPTDVQTAVSAAATARGMKLGAWVTAALRAALVTEGQVVTGDDLSLLVQRLTARVDALEARQRPASAVQAARVLQVRDAPRTVPSGAPAGNAPKKKGGARAPIPADHAEEANRLQAEGMSFAQIIETKGWNYNRAGLANKVAKLRKARDVTGLPTER